MCGIFAYTGESRESGRLIVNGLRSLEYRGYDSWGVALKKSNGQIYLKKAVGKIGQAILPDTNSSIGFGHTRWATHGGVTEKNSHPHHDCQKKIFVVHNGIVENFAHIKNVLSKSGHHFISDTDTEIIAHLIEQKLKKQKSRSQAVLKTFNQITGMNALIVFFPDYEEFYAIKNGSPIVFGKNKKEKIIASDASAIIPYTKKVYFLEDNELLIVTGKEEKLIDKQNKNGTIRYLNLSYDKQDVEVGSYPNFMFKEISEQPKVLRDIINTQRGNLGKTSQIIRKARGSYLIGCGTAYYAAISGSYLFAKIAKRHIDATIGSEFGYLTDFLTEKSLVIALSQSGETIDTISGIKKAREKKAKIMAITNVLGSTLYRISDYRILLQAGPEKCVLATKSFTAKIAVLYLLSHCLNGSYDQGVNQIKKAIGETERLIKSTQIKELANRLKNSQHIYVLGRGVSYPTALESALKIKEVSYIHAEGFASGELKHGVIALIKKGTPVIVYNPTDETYKDTLSSAYEMKARGAYIIGIAEKNSPVFDEFIQVNDCQEAVIIPNVVVAQLLGYYLAVSKGYDPDKPRNLAKSVTVK